MHIPSRGDAWYDLDGNLLLVVSADWFNRSTMRDVVILGVYPGDQRDDGVGPYGMVVTVDGEPWTIVRDEITVIEKSALGFLAWQAPAPVMGAIDTVLRTILTPIPPVFPAPAPPIRHPRRGNVRYASLWIAAGRQVKPIVIISSAEYGRMVAHEYVVACRASSKVAIVRETDVVIGTASKVVCSNIMSVPAADIRNSGPAGLRRVSDTDAEKIRRTVFRVLGI